MPILCTGQAARGVVNSPGTDNVVLIVGLDYCLPYVGLMKNSTALKNVLLNHLVVHLIRQSVTKN